MDLFEFQGKQLMARWGVPVPAGAVVDTPKEAAAAAERLGPVVAVKAQVKVGGRGKAGGIKVVQSPEAARSAAESILGMQIRSHTVQQVLIESGVKIASEAYLSILLDRSSKKHLIIACAEGGVDIEAVAKTRPEALTRVLVDPLLGLRSFQVARIVKGLGFAAEARKAAAAVVADLFTLYEQADASLVEVNPLVVTASGEVVALDAKVSLDDSALFRHPDFEQLRSVGGDEREQMARRYGLSNFVALEGEVGIVGNGAGLVMSTLDLIDQVGGRAANFLDVGGGADPTAVTNALRLILADGGTKSVLVNIFGGITRCDQVASGVVEALGAIQVDVPIVVRLAGTNASEGLRIMEQARHPRVVLAKTMLEAAQKAVEATK
ncbi:MAG: ADP-forming succinate--CoA ligase subunit beta [Actinomycetota bacterium]